MKCKTFAENLKDLSTKAWLVLYLGCNRYKHYTDYQIKKQEIENLMREGKRNKINDIDIIDYLVVPSGPKDFRDSTCKKAAFKTYIKAVIGKGWLISGPTELVKIYVCLWKNESELKDWSDYSLNIRKEILEKYGKDITYYLAIAHRKYNISPTEDNLRDLPAIIKQEYKRLLQSEDKSESDKNNNKEKAEAENSRKRALTDLYLTLCGWIG